MDLIGLSAADVCVRGPDPGVEEAESRHGSCSGTGGLTVRRQARLLFHTREMRPLLLLLSLLSISLAPAYAESQAEREARERDANWREFRSDNYGISFEYPRPWHRDDGGEQLGRPDIRVYLPSPDLSIQSIYTGGDFPEKMVWHNGATLEFEVWRRRTLAPRVFDDLQTCLAKARLPRTNLHIDLTHWKWPRCPDQGGSSVDVVNADIVSIAGRKSLRYELRHPKDRVPVANVSIVDLRLIHPNDQLLVAITFATVATKRDTYLKIFERILSTVRFRHPQTGSLSPGSPERPLEGPLITAYAPRPERFELALDEIVLDWGGHPGTPAQSAVATPGAVVVEREAVLALFAAASESSTSLDRGRGVEGRKSRR